MPAHNLKRKRASATGTTSGDVFKRLRAEIKREQAVEASAVALINALAQALRPLRKALKQNLTKKERKALKRMRRTRA
jgi:hypothetical protein